MKRGTFSFSALLSAATVAMVLPNLAFAGAGCDDLCGVNTQNVKDKINDPKCKADPNCVSCVQQAVGGSQSGLQCAAYSKTKKGRTGEIINATLNTAATITCGVACALSSSVPAAAGYEAWVKVCGFSGLAVTASEVGFTIANLVKGDGGGAGEWIGLATKALTVKSNIAMAKSATIATSSATTRVGKMIENPACMNTVLFGIAAGMKIASIAKDTKMQSQACSNAQALAGDMTAPVQACMAKAGATVNQASSLAGLFSPTVETFQSVTLDAADHQAATAGEYLKDLKDDMQFAASKGKFDLDGIAKKLDAGGKLSDVLANTGIPPELSSALKSAEDEINKKEQSPFASDSSGAGGYASAAGTGASSTAGVDMLAFGNAGGASPGEGASENLEIDRKPAHAASAAGLDDGDVFHGAFAGTIFDIVTNRLKAEKSNYAELDPEARMNRLFNGYRDVKTERKPAGAAKALAK